MARPKLGYFIKFSCDCLHLTSLLTLFPCGNYFDLITLITRLGLRPTPGPNQFDFDRLLPTHLVHVDMSACMDGQTIGWLGTVAHLVRQSIVMVMSCTRASSRAITPSRHAQPTPAKTTLRLAVTK